MEGTVGTDERGGSRESRFGALLRLRIELWLVVVFMALSFAAGIVVTALYEEPAQQSIVGSQQPADQAPIAPPLTDEQIQGGLPSGHPDVAGGTGSVANPDGQGSGDASGGSK